MRLTERALGRLDAVGSRAATLWLGKLFAAQRSFRKTNGDPTRSCGKTRVLGEDIVRCDQRQSGRRTQGTEDLGFIGMSWMLPVGMVPELELHRSVARTS